GTYQAAANMSLGSLHLQRARASDRRAAGALQRGDDAAALRQQAEDENQAAIGFFEAGLSAADTPRQLKILLNLIPARHRAQDLSAAQANYRQAIALLDQLPPSRSKAYATIDLATLLPLTLSLELPRQSLSGTVCPSIDLPAPIRAQTENLLQRAIATAQVTGDYRAQSFAYGKLGHLYECDLRYEKALAFTQDAEWAADQALESYDSLYLWQWQTGRILRQKAAQDDAIASYEAAATTLKKIRSDILTAERDLQFDFRDAVEPLYRELVELRLAQATTSQTGPDDTNESATASGEGDPADDIGAALITIDELRLAELQNYFGDECLILASVDADEAEEAAGASYPNTGIFSTFITDDRTAVVLTLPDGQRRVEWLSQGERQINELVNRFRLSLEESLNFPDTYDPNVPGPNSVNAAFNPSLSATLYEKLIRPFAADLASAKDVKTLVFIQDGIFRSIPMGALYDRESKRYLIQDYAIATTPSLSLTPSPTRRRRLRALALGLSEQATVEDEDFRALEGVSVELNQIEEQLPGSKRLLNADFTFNRLRQALREEEYSIVHMATHGEFGAEPEDTFLVTGDTDDTGKNKKLTIGDLEQALRQSGGTQQIDVLTLTACKTAIGDDRSTLGLAGVAVQAGARSAVASLWSIEDFSTATIINDFYGFLKDPNLSKAKALQSAQVAALTSNDSNLSKPGYWAPFLLIGDWQ
ncbi:MAG: CHAT domain-containing protein, partial [Cyanobacteria bacterium P01_A01_bin.135]